MPRTYIRIPAEERFWAKVNKDGPLWNGTPCWLWTASQNNHGYGMFQKHTLAHRFVYELLVGSIPEGLEIDHLCRNHLCVNPGHLEPVTHRENGLRGTASIVNASLQKSKTHCPRGHPYDLFNTYTDKRGYRNCRRCGLVAVTAYIRRQREQN